MSTSAAPGPNEGVGLAAIQMPLRWFPSALEFCETVDRLAARARSLGADVAVYPEDVGLLIAFGDEASGLQLVTDIRTAVRALFSKYQAQAMELMQRHPVGPARALLLLRAQTTRERYVSMFSDVARRHSLYVVAGTAPLTRAEDGDDPSAVYNMACTFGPDGALLGTQCKVHLIDIERLPGLDLTAGRPEDYHAIRTPLGGIGVSVCADTFDEHLTERLVADGAQVIADPKANPKLWTVDESAENRKSAWSRCQERPLYAVQAFGVGQLVGIPFQGRSAIYAPCHLTPDGSGVLAQARTHSAEDVVVARVRLEDLGQ